MIGEANAYIDAQAPWKLKKEDPDRMQTVLFVLAEVIRCVTIMAQPIVPNGTAKILDQLAVSADERGFDMVNADHQIVSGTSLPAPEGVFPRIELANEKAAYLICISIIVI